MPTNEKDFEKTGTIGALPGTGFKIMRPSGKGVRKIWVLDLMAIEYKAYVLRNHTFTYNINQSIKKAVSASGTNFRNRSIPQQSSAGSSGSIGIGVKCEGLHAQCSRSFARIRFPG